MTPLVSDAWEFNTVTGRRVIYTILLGHCSGGHRSCEKIAFTTCQMSNVCCAMFNVVVKTPDDLLTKPPNPQWETIASSGHFVSESFYKFIGHRTTDIRLLTALAVVDFFTVPMTARGPPTLPSQKET